MQKIKTLFSSQTVSLTCDDSQGKIYFLLQIYNVNTKNDERQLQRKYHKLLYLGHHADLRANFNTIHKIVEHFQNPNNFRIDAENGDVYLYKEGKMIFMIQMQEDPVPNSINREEVDVFKPMIIKPYYGFNRLTYNSSESEKEPIRSSEAPVMIKQKQTNNRRSHQISDERITNIQQRIEMKMNRKFKKLYQQLSHLKDNFERQNQIIERLTENSKKHQNKIFELEQRLKDNKILPKQINNKQQQKNAQKKIEQKEELIENGMEEVQLVTQTKKCKWMYSDSPYRPQKLKIIKNQLFSLSQTPLLIHSRNPIPNTCYTFQIKIKRFKTQIGIGIAQITNQILSAEYFQNKNKAIHQSIIMLTTNGTVEYLGKSQKNQDVWFRVKNGDLLSIIIQREKKKVQFRVGSETVMIIEDCDKIEKGNWGTLVYLTNKLDCVQIRQF